MSLLEIKHPLILQQNLQAFLARVYVVSHNWEYLSKWRQHHWLHYTDTKWVYDYDPDLDCDKE